MNLFTHISECVIQLQSLVEGPNSVSGTHTPACSAHF